MKHQPSARKKDFQIDLQSCGGRTLTVARNSWIAEGGGEAVGRQYPVCMRTGKQRLGHVIPPSFIKHGLEDKLETLNHNTTYWQRDLSHMCIHPYPIAGHL